MTVRNIDSVAVLGAGAMGHGIAELFALADYSVRLRDINEDLAQEGYDQIAWSLEKLAEHGQITDEQADAAIERVMPVADLSEAVSDVDMLVEAVPEKMDIKKDVFEAVDENALEDSIFATNTSSFSISELAAVTDRPEQFCGMHFFNPPIRMELVEVIRGDETSDETMNAAEAVAEDIGKTPVRVQKDSPGFIVNRVLVPMINEAAWMVYTGDASIAEVDSSTKYGLGLPMGILELADYTGIDICYDVAQYLHEVLGEGFEPSPLLASKVEAEELGKKTGQGFYDHDDEVEIPEDAADEDLEIRSLGIMANQIARLLDEEVTDAEGIDRAMKLGAAYPEGPATMADKVGLDRIVSALKDLHERTGAPRYEPDEHLVKLADAGATFHD